MKQYIVYIPQIESNTVITGEERDKYLKKLQKLKKTYPELMIDYGDEEQPYYDLDRRIDEFDIDEAIDNLEDADFVEVEETAFGKDKTFAKLAYKDYRENKWALDRWFDDFVEASKNSK